MGSSGHPKGYPSQSNICKNTLSVVKDFFKVFYDIFLKKMDFRYDFEKRLSILSNMHKIRMSLIVLNPFINLKNDNIKQYKLCKQYFKSESIFFSEMFT